MSGELILYTNPFSRGRTARWMLEETGAPYRAEVLQFGQEMRAPAYLALNPIGKVPTLRHGDTVVTECAAICAYLADTFPESGLAPAPAERGAYYRALFFAAGPFEAAVTDHALGFVIPQDKRVMCGYGSYGAAMDTLETLLSASPYVTGNRFTAADVYVGAQVGWGLRFGTIEARPAFTAYWDRLKDRPALLSANAADDALAAKIS